MRNSYKWFALLLIVFLLVACGETEEETVATEESEIETEQGQEKLEETEARASEEIEEEIEEVPEVEPLSRQEVEEIVIDNLDQMDASQDEFEYQEAMAIVNETIIDPEHDTEEVTEIIEATKEKFKHLVSGEIIDDWTRSYLDVFYWTMSRQHLHSNDISARFEVLNQSEDSFTASFIRLADEVGYYPAGTYHLDYVKENGHWVFREIEFFSAEDKPLNITMNEVEENYARSDRNNAEVLSFFEAIEEVEVNGENYLIYKAYNRYHARNAVDSEYNFDVSDPYNSKNE